MTAPEGARDALEGHCASDDCDWHRWEDMAACVHCTKAFCADHVLADDHGCEEAER